jgi:uncharacterized protein YaaN involved in tellurite resistance
MNAQLELFQSQQLTDEQRKLLNTLIELKSDEIHNKEFNIFYGTVQEIDEKRKDVDKKIENFSKKVYKAFPGLAEDSKTLKELKNR